MWLAAVLCTTGALGTVPIEGEVGDDAELGNQTVVTPSRVTGTAFDSARTVHRLGESEIESGQPVDGPEAVGWLPGVALQRTNRAAGAPILRGLIGPSNLILVDGVRFNTSTFRTGPNQYAAFVDPMALRSIEVVLGPGSVLYGSDAMGGVMQFLTRGVPTAQGWFGRGVSRLSSADFATELGLEVAARRGGVAGWAGGSLRRHGVLRVGGGDEVDRSDYLQGGWRAKVQTPIGTTWRLTATLLGTRIDDAARIDNIGKGDLRLYSNTDNLSLLTLEPLELAGALRDLRLTVSHHHLRDGVERTRCHKEGGTVSDRAACLAADPSAVTKIERTDDTVDVLGASLTARGRWLGGRLQLTTGFDARHEMVGSAKESATEGSGFAFEAEDRGTFSDGSTYTGADGFAMLEGRPLVWPGQAELVLTGGVRLSQVSAFAPDVPGLGDVAYEASSPVFSAGARVLLQNRFNVYGSWSQGFRAPNLQETTAIGDTGTFFEIPNDQLGPERSDTVEAGIKTATPWLRAHAAWFHTELRDAITRVDGTWQDEEQVDGKDVKQRINADEATYTGVEFGVSTLPWHGVSAFGSAAWIQGEERIEGQPDQPARRVPPFSAEGGLRWDRGDGKLYLMALVRGAAEQGRLHADDRKDLRICEDPARPGHPLLDGAPQGPGACEGTPGWTTTHFAAGYDVDRNVHTELRVDNVLDARYRLHGSGFDSPGFDARFTIRYGF